MTTNEVIVKKKRGRKPKNYVDSSLDENNSTKQLETINSEDEKIIFHLPITINEINNKDTDIDNIFIKSELDINKKNKIEDKIEDISENISVDSSSEKKIYLNNSINNINTHILTFASNTKCWWCRNSFTTHPVQLPEDYYNNTFFCVGHFCSYNCAVAHNIDLNDIMTSKRISLINLLYYKTYSDFNKIIAAPHWITLEEYGGTLSITGFRENSVKNTKEYLVLHPPLISRQMQIEESYKHSKFKDVQNSDQEQKYTIKRNKPINNNQLNLEITMGLIKKIK